MLKNYQPRHKNNLDNFNPLSGKGGISNCFHHLAIAGHQKPVKMRENLRHGDKTLVIDGSPILVEEHWDHRLYQFTINPNAYKSTASTWFLMPS